MRSSAVVAVTMPYSRKNMLAHDLLLNDGIVCALLALIGALIGRYNAENEAAVGRLAKELELPFVLYGVALIVAALGCFVADHRRIEESDAPVNPVDIYKYVIRNLTTKALWTDRLSKASWWGAIALFLVSLCLFGVASWMSMTELAAFHI